jgi:carnitine O-acetyltransferase
VLGCRQSDHHVQARQAARIAAAAFEFKKQINDGLEPDFLNDQRLCMASVDWIFNCTREPNPNKDLVRKYPSHDHCIVLRNGHLFEVALVSNGKALGWEQLEEIFYSIIKSSGETAHTLAPLTADDRDRWSQVSHYPV